MKFRYLFLLVLCLFPIVSAAQTWNLHFSDGTVTINATDICVEDGTCLTDSAVGDVTQINTDGPYLVGGAESGAVSLLFNSSALNLTITALSTGNQSFNETWTDTLYASIGAGNASWNETWANTLYADIGVVTDNSSFNQILTDAMYANINDTNTSWAQTLADTLYADITIVADNESWTQVLGDTLYADIAVTGDNSSWSETYAIGIFNQSFNQIWTDTQYRIGTWDNFTGIPTAAVTDNDDTHLSTANQIYDWAVGIFLQAMDYTNMALTNITETFGKSLIVTNNITAALYNGNGSMLTGVNESWTQVFADTQYLTAMDYTNLALTNISETFDINVTAENIVFETSALHSIGDNATCTIIKGSTSTFEIC